MFSTSKVFNSNGMDGIMSLFRARTDRYRVLGVSGCYFICLAVLAGVTSVDGIISKFDECLFDGCVGPDCYVYNANRVLRLMGSNLSISDKKTSDTIYTLSGPYHFTIRDLDGKCLYNPGISAGGPFVAHRFVNLPIESASMV